MGRGGRGVAGVGVVSTLAGWLSRLPPLEGPQWRDPWAPLLLSSLLRLTGSFLWSWVALRVPAHRSWGSGMSYLSLSILIC